MIIKKYLHSCILIEENGKKLLIDPGVYSFIEGKLKPQDIGKVDVIAITHLHPDHCSVEAIKELLRLRQAVIIAPADAKALLAKEGIDCEEAKNGEEKLISGFNIKVLDAPHEKILSEVPQNFAYLVNDSFLHTGDSIHVAGAGQVKVAALPVAGPWNRLWEAVDFAKGIKPQIVIPVHDAIIKDFFIKVMDDFMCKPALDKAGIEFKRLGLGDQLEI